MKYHLLHLFILLLVSGIISGCGKPHRPPPMEHIELTARFFRSLEQGNSESALRQAKKLCTLDPDASYIVTLTSIQEANDTIATAQSALERGEINRALHIIREGRRRHTGNRTFSEVYPKVFQLRNAKKLFRAMARAKNSSAMRSARIAARAGLSMNMTPELQRYLADYELRGAAVAAKEKADIIAAERAAQEAAMRAKIEEEKRKAAEKQFVKETQRKSAEGERLRRNNKFPQFPQVKN